MTLFDSPVARYNSSYRPDVEGLRGVAVLFVVAYHSFSRPLSGGFIGVDVFFVLSGYLITGLLVREIEDHGRISLLDFYARRVRRLLPASVLVLLATVVAFALLATPIAQYRTGTSSTSTSLYISNLWFLRQAVDYFEPDIKLNPFLHTWSLAVEEQFYFVFPAIIALSLHGKRSRDSLVIVLITVSAASFAACIYLTGTHRSWAFFSSPTRAWEFAAGALALLIGSRAGSVIETLRPIASWLGLAAIVAASLSFNGEQYFPGLRASIPVLGTVLILLSRHPRWGAARVLELPLMQWLGQLSYSLYLWHWPVLVIARDIDPQISPLFRMVSVGLAFVLAVVTHYTVENPIRLSRYLATRRMLTIALSAAITIVAVSVTISWQQSVARFVNEPARQAILRAAARSSPVWVACRVELADTQVRDCIRANPAGRYTIALFGDSHALHWEPAFEALAEARGWRLLLFSKPSCPTPRMTVFNGYLNRDFPECDVWREAAIQRIVTLRPDALVIVNATLFAAGSNPYNDHQEWRNASRLTLQRFDSASIPTVVLHDNPWPGFNVPNCIAGLLTRQWTIYRHPNRRDCNFTRRSGVNEAIDRADRRSVDGLRHVSFLDLTNLFCDESTCPAVKNGIIVYYDSHHLTADFATSLGPLLASRLAPLLPERLR